MQRQPQEGGCQGELGAGGSGTDSRLPLGVVVPAGGPHPTGTSLAVHAPAPLCQLANEALDAGLQAIDQGRVPAAAQEAAVCPPQEPERQGSGDTYHAASGLWPSPAQS